MALYQLLKKGSFRLPLTLIACTVLLICAIVYSNNYNRIDNTLRVATSHEPEDYSELYFTDYAKLPKNLVVGTSYTVSFTIVNHESNTFAYSYQAKFVERNISNYSAVKTVTVANGQTVHETIRIIARQSGDQVELFVRLLNKNLTIHYKAQS